MHASLKGEVALVTGASRGIGAAIADRLAASGALVIGTATSESGAQAITSRLSAFGGGGRVLDVCDSVAVETLIDAIGKEFGAISILVNNAGITRDQLLLRMKEEDWQVILDTNLSSVFRTSKAVLRGMMKARKGRIISIASVIGAIGNAGQSNYAAAKAGIIAFSKSLAREIGSRGVTVNVVAPGFIDTDMTRALPEEQRSALLGQIALQRSVKRTTSPRPSPSWRPRGGLHHRGNPARQWGHAHGLSDIRPENRAERLVAGRFEPHCIHSARTPQRRLSTYPAVGGSGYRHVPLQFAALRSIHPCAAEATRCLPPAVVRHPIHVTRSHRETTNS